MSEVITCVICGNPTGPERKYSAALMVGNLTRDPHVGPYCSNCGPPKAVAIELCLETCPRTGKKECDYSLGPSPFREGYVSCIHPGWRRKP